MKLKATFVTVRTSSTRLPQKCLKNLQGQAVIEFILRYLKKSKYAEKIIVCTTQRPEDEVLCQIATRCGADFFQGSEEDKLERWRGAAEKFGVEFFVTADGDDVFCEPELIDLAFEQYARTGADFIQASGLVCGAFTYGIKTSALQKVCEIKATDETEMMWVYFTDTGLFRVEELQGVPALFRRPEIRMTLDYADDFRFFDTIVKHFYGLGKRDFNLRDIIAYLDQNPGVVQINQYLQERFLQNQKAKTTLRLKEKTI